MNSVFLCHAPEDAGAAADLKKYLEAGTCLEVDAGALPDGETVATWYDRGGADVALLMLSPRSIPAGRSVEEWQGVLDELERDALGSVLVTPCRKPQRLERRNYFEASNQRAVKQWLIAKFAEGERLTGLPSPHPSYRADDAELNVLRCAVGDRAGRARLSGKAATVAAIDFAHRFADDFDRVVWSHCGDGTLEGAVSDVAMRLGLRLNGPLEADLDAMAEYVSGRRYLLVLDRPPEDLFDETGKTSLLVTGTVPGMYHYDHRFDSGIEDPVPSMMLEAVSRLPAGCTRELAQALTGMETPTCEDLFAAGALLKIGEGRYWSPARRPELLTLDDAGVIMRHLVKRRDAEDLPNAEAALRRALREPVEEAAWELAKRLCSVASSVARDHGRAAELHALVSLMAPVARARADMRTQEECLRERRWIEESWGMKPDAAETEDLTVRQLELGL
jgi:hypothetical protein